MGFLGLRELGLDYWASWPTVEYSSGPRNLELKVLGLLGHIGPLEIIHFGLRTIRLMKMPI